MDPIILVESPSARRELIAKVSVLDTIQPPVPYLTKDQKSTVKLVAEWYSVSEDATKRILQRNREEFSVDGIEIVDASTMDISSICEGQLVPGKIRKLTLLPRQAILRIGMMLTESARATTVRDLLLAGEKQLTFTQRVAAVKQVGEWELRRKASKEIRGYMTGSLSDCLPESPHKQMQYRNFTDLAYRHAFGKSTKELREERGATDVDNLRDGFTVEELRQLERTELFIAGCLQFGMGYRETKAALEQRKSVGVRKAVAS